MALIASNTLGQMARAGGTYIAGRAVQALADRVERVISTTSPQEVNAALARFAPGKANKAKRNAAKRLIIGQAVRATNAMRQAPVAIARPAPRFNPRFNMIRGRYSVGNKEFMANLQPSSAGSSELNVLEFNAQVGLAEMFPWLSTIANTHQRYRVHKLKFEYVPVCGTTTRGRIILAFSIDPTETAPISMSQITQYPNYEANSVWTPITLVANLSDRQDELYTRAGAVTNTDIKTYDLGKLFVGISDTTDTDTIGQLFVEYEVELMTPKPTSCPASNDFFPDAVDSNLFQLENGGSVALDGSNVVGTLTGSTSFLRFDAPGVYLVVTSGTGTTPSLTIDDTDLDGHVDNLHALSSTVTTLRISRVNVVSPSSIELNATNVTALTVRTAMFREGQINH